MRKLLLYRQNYDEPVEILGIITDDELENFAKFHIERSLSSGENKNITRELLETVIKDSCVDFKVKTSSYTVLDQIFPEIIAWEGFEYTDLDTFKLNNFKESKEDYVMDEFDRTIKILHESTHDKDIRESLLKTIEYKRRYFREDILEKMKKVKCYYCGKIAIGEFDKYHNKSYVKIPKCGRCFGKNMTGYSNLIFELVRAGSISEAILSQSIKEAGETFFGGQYMSITNFYNQLTIEQLKELKKTEIAVVSNIDPWVSAAIEILEEKNN